MRSVLTPEQGSLLEQQLFEFNQLWFKAEEDARVDSITGLEWRISVLIFLTAPEDDRAAWLAQPEDWKLDHLSWLTGLGERG